VAAAEVMKIAAGAIPCALSIQRVGEVEVVGPDDALARGAWGGRELEHPGDTGRRA
jgi:hypothetical protein